MSELDRLKAILKYLPDPVFVITRSGRYASAYGGRDTRYYHDGSPLVGLSASDFMEPEQARWLVEEVAKALDSQSLHIVEYSMSGSDISELDGIGPADTLWFEARIQALPFDVDGEEAVLWVASNITERHRMEVDLRRLSHTDALTDLWNRHYFETIAHEEFRAKRRDGLPVSVLIADIDHFKAINDTHGHLVGDQVLKGVASVLNGHLRDVDIATRWGGEEFIILMPGAGPVQAQLAAEKMRQVVALRDFGDGLRATISLGVACCIDQCESLTELIARADSALYQAKAGGRDKVCVADNPEDNPVHDSQKGGAAWNRSA